MTTVTGLTAERMLAIEDESIVGGAVNLAGHLILTRHDGGTIDAGYIVDQTSVVDIHTNQNNIDGLKTFLQKVSVSLGAAGSSLDLNKEAASMGGGSLNISRTTPAAQPQSLVFRTGLVYNFVIGRAAGSDDLKFGVDGGGGFTEKARIQTDGGVLASGDNHYFGGNALNGAGGRMRLYAPAADPANGYIIVESSAASINLNLQTKGVGALVLRNGAGVTLLQVDSAGNLSSMATDLYLGGYAFGAAGTSRLHIGTSGSAVYLTAEGDTAARDLVLRSKGTGSLYIQDEGGNIRYQNDSSGTIKSKGQNNLFGLGAFGAAGTYMNIGDLGDPGGVYAVAYGTPANVNLILRSKGTGQIQLQEGGGSTILVVTNNAHLKAAGPTPALSAFGAGVTGGSVSGHDTAGVISLNTNGVALAARPVHVTFANAYPTPPAVIVGIGSMYPGYPDGFIQVFASGITTTGFDLQLSAAVTPPAGTVTFPYITFDK